MHQVHEARIIYLQFDTHISEKPAKDHILITITPSAGMCCQEWQDATRIHNLVQPFELGQFATLV